MPDSKYKEIIDREYNQELDLYNSSELEKANRDLGTKLLMEKLDAKAKLG